MAEIAAVEERWPSPFLEFADDNTFVNREWSKDLLRALADKNLRWFTECDISVAEDPELLELLAAAGCQQVLIGLESPNSDDLSSLDSANFKRSHVDQYRTAIKAIQSRGVAVNGCFVLGLDNHLPTIFKKVRDFILTSGLLEAQVTLLTPFPGTVLYHQLREEGRLLEDKPWSLCTLFDVTYQPAAMSVAELEEGLRWLISEIYTDEVYDRRRRQYVDIQKRLLRARSPQIAAQ